MTKSELVAAIATLTGQSKAATDATIDALATTVQRAVSAGEKISVPGVFTTVISDKKARVMKNPATGAEVHVPAKKAIRLKAAKALCDAANGK